MSMITWLIIIGILYLIALGTLAYRARKEATDAESFMLAGGNLGYIIGFMTVAATLFSAFTLQGMPDFFRTHGIGSWIFLAISDGAMVFMIVFFAYYLRKKVAEKGYKGMAGLLRDCYETPLAGYVYFLGVFLFLIPYVAVQIRGIGIFLEAVFPDALPFWAWGLFIIGLMLLYSETGGLKAIIHADVLQGILLMIVVWIIAITCLNSMGGIGEMFRQIEAKEAALLSVPGPKGLFTVQFLVASFFGIISIPITQPQVSSRLVIMKDLRATHRMAVAVGIFAILVILPTLPIGFYGALKYGDMSPAEFINQVLLFDQAAWVAAAAVIGLFAASISTSDSQIFALGGEFRSLLGGSEKSALLRTKIALVVFALAAWGFSILANDQLVLLARVSFTGTALMTPMVLAAILTKKAPGPEIVLWAALGIISLVLSLLKVFPPSIAGIRMDLFIFLTVGLLTLLSLWRTR